MIVKGKYFVDNYQERKELISLPPSSKFILYILKQNGSMRKKQVQKKTLLPNRTVSYALRILMEKGFIRKEKSQKDKRVSIYEAVI